MQSIRKVLNTDKIPLNIMFASFAQVLHEIGCTSLLIPSLLSDDHYKEKIDGANKDTVPNLTPEQHNEVRLVREMWQFLELCA